jgi:hypothetical protein
MPTLIGSPTRLATVGILPKFSDEYVGLVNTGDSKVSMTWCILRRSGRQLAGSQSFTNIK